MALLEFKNIDFSYAINDRIVLNQLNFQVENGDFVLLLGPSGSGKTTLIKLLKKSMRPEGRLNGEILFKDDNILELSKRQDCVNFGYVGQNPEDQVVTDKVWHELAFGLENMGCESSLIKLRVSETAEFFGISDWYNMSVNKLSGGQKQLLNLAAVMVMRPEVLLLDEPTSQLDPVSASRFIEMVYKLNRELGTTIIMSEHRIENIFPLATKVLLLDKGSITHFGTPFDTAEFLVNNNMTQQMPNPLKLCKLCGSDRIFYDVINARKFLKEKGYTGVAYKELKENPDKSAEVVLQAKNVSFKYDKNEPLILNKIDFEINKGTLTTILGGNGAGKSTLLSCISKVNKVFSGKITSKGKIVYLVQNPRAVFTEVSVEEELGSVMIDKANRWVADISREKKLEIVEEALREHDLCEFRKQNPYDLSGGQQQKLALVKALLYKPDILLLDEPTKGLDPSYKVKLGELLKKLTLSGVTVVMVSHDVEFCAEYADNCGFLFNREIVFFGSAKEFFAGNSYFTTTAVRIQAGIVKHPAITCQELADNFLSLLYKTDEI